MIDLEETMNKVLTKPKKVRTNPKKKRKRSISGVELYSQLLEKNIKKTFNE